MTNKQRVLTGITTSGTPHIGNLAGAILPAIKASKDSSTMSFLFLADYHSLIKNLDPELTYASSYKIAASWLACGLDPKKVIFYRQSDIPHIFELAWILGCLTSKGLMNRAHAYKAAITLNEASGSKDMEDGITMGLFNYPILMAADILMFNADVVPVGQDQKQHIEMTRDIAKRFNHYYGETFTIPEAQISQESGVVPGTDGQKMSKSHDNVVPAFASKDELRKSIMKIKTNSLEPGEPKEWENCSIFQIYTAFSDSEQINDLRKLYLEGIAWGKAKDMLFELLDEKLTSYREEYNRILSNKGEIEVILKDGSEKALEISSTLISKIRKVVGIRGLG